MKSEPELRSLELWALGEGEVGDSTLDLIADIRALRKRVTQLLGVHFNCPGCGRVIRNEDGNA
jgi:hypothetical protein